MLVIDNYALFYFGVIIVCTLACATLSHAYLEGYSGNKEEMYLLLTLSALGGLVLVCSQHLAGLFIGLELMSVPLYAMVAYSHKNRHSLEGGLKYLVLSAAEAVEFSVVRPRGSEAFFSTGGLGASGVGFGGATQDCARPGGIGRRSTRLLASAPHRVECGPPLRLGRSNVGRRERPTGPGRRSRSSSSARPARRR